MAYAVRHLVPGPLSAPSPARSESAQALTRHCSSLASSPSVSTFLYSPRFSSQLRGRSLRSSAASPRFPPRRFSSFPPLRLPVHAAGVFSALSPEPAFQPARKHSPLLDGVSASLSVPPFAASRSPSLPASLLPRVQSRFLSNEGKDKTPEPEPRSPSPSGASEASVSATPAPRTPGDEAQRFLQFCEVASGVMVSSPAVSAEQKQWIFSGEEERGVKSPGGFLGLVFAFNQKFHRLRDLGFFVLLSCKQGARQALVLLSEELSSGIQEAQKQHTQAQSREARVAKRGLSAANTSETPAASGVAANQAQGEETGRDAGEPDAAELEAKLAGEGEKPEKEEERQRQECSVTQEGGRPARENIQMALGKTGETETDSAHADDSAPQSPGAGSLENLKNCVGEALLAGMQAKLGEAVAGGCRLTFEIGAFQKVHVARMWTVCGAPAGHHAPILPRSSYLVPVTPFLHAILPPAARSAFFVSPQYLRYRRGLLVKDAPVNSLMEGEFPDEEVNDEAWHRPDGLSGDAGDKEEKGHAAGDARKPEGENSSAAAQKAPLSFPEKFRKVMERLELLDQALGKGLAVVMEVELLCKQTFAVHDKDMKLLFGSEEEEQVVHTLRFQLTARRDGKQWGVPTFQPSSWTLVDWNGLVGSEYPCSVGALRNVVVVEKDEDLPKGKKVCYE
nr:TPA: hypothetical protein BN1204_033480 [Neospora caninum Liverpool]